MASLAERELAAQALAKAKEDLDRTCELANEQLFERASENVHLQPLVTAVEDQLEEKLAAEAELGAAVTALLEYINDSITDSACTPFTKRELREQKKMLSKIVK